jgi:hypothetical protein
MSKPEGTNDGATLAACCAHDRRKSFELQANESSLLVTGTVEAMRPLDRGRHPGPCGTDPRTKFVSSTRHPSWPICSRSGKRSARGSRAVKACGSIRQPRRKSDVLKRAIRPYTITRKTAPFAVSDGGGPYLGHNGDTPDHRENG